MWYGKSPFPLYFCLFSVGSNQRAKGWKLEIEWSQSIWCLPGFILWCRRLLTCPWQTIIRRWYENDKVVWHSPGNAITSTYIVHILFCKFWFDSIVFFFLAQWQNSACVYCLLAENCSCIFGGGTGWDFYKKSTSELWIIQLVLNLQKVLLPLVGIRNLPTFLGNGSSWICHFSDASAETAIFYVKY